MRYLFLLCFAISHGLLAQCPDIATLIEIGDERVSQEDFVRLYTKNNIDGSADFSEESLKISRTLHQLQTQSAGGLRFGNGYDKSDPKGIQRLPFAIG